MLNVVMLELADGSVAQIDAADLTLVACYEWRLPSPGRPIGQHPIGTLPGRRGRGERIFLHRLIAHAGPDDIVLHRNHDTLDNRRDNLVVLARQPLPAALPRDLSGGAAPSALLQAD